MDTIRFHSMLAKGAFVVALVIGALLAAVFVRYSQTFNVPDDVEIFDVVEGTWAWADADSNCATNSHTIRFTPDHGEMVITSARPYERADGKMDSIARYQIISQTRDRIRGAIYGETRLTADGRPVVWDLVLRSPDRYVWHRTDWPAFGFTGEVHRCPREHVDSAGPPE